MKQIWFERGGALVLAICACYLWLAPAHPIDGESAEFAALSLTGGAAHPPGYPLYVTWLHAMSSLPGANAAHTAALATSLLAVAGFACLFAACKAWGARPLAASLTVAIVAAAPVVLRVETEPEVFALNNLFAALILWLAAERGPLRGTWRTGALGLVAGLALMHHPTIGLLAPIGLVGAVRGVRESKRRALAALGGLVMFAAGVAPYALLLVARDAPMSWGRVRDVDGLVAMFLRHDHGGPRALAPYAGEVDTRANLIAFAWTTLRAWLVLPVGIALFAFARGVLGKRAGARIGWLALALSWVLAGPMLAATLDVPPEGVGLLVCQRFYVLSLVVLAPAVACGVDTVLAAGARSLHVRTALPGVIGAIAVLLFGTLIVTGLREHRTVASRALEASIVNTLQGLPPQAVVITQTDDVASAAVYVQSVLGVRRDVTLITGGKLRLAWYRERIAAQGVAVDPSPLVVAEHVLASGRPLFVDLAGAPILGTYPTYPHGWLFRVLPRGSHVPPLDAIIDLNREITGHLDLDYPRPGPDDGYPSAVHRRYAQPWKLIARALGDTGRANEAKDALELARELAPGDTP